MNLGAKKASMRLCGATFLACGITFAFPAFAFASEGSSASGISAILPDMEEFLPMLVAFIVLWILLGKFGWPKFNAMLDKREQTIKESLERSEKARIESERVLQEYRAQLEDAKLQAAEIVADAKKTGQAVKADITAKAQSEATHMVDKARQAIESEKKAALAELQKSVADTSIAVASKLIGQNLSDDEHRAIIERYVNEAGSINAN